MASLTPFRFLDHCGGKTVCSFKPESLKKLGYYRRQIDLSLDIAEQHPDELAGQALAAVIRIHAERAQFPTIRMFLEAADPPDSFVLLGYPKIIGFHIAVIEAVPPGEFKNLREIRFSGFSNTHGPYYTAFDMKMGEL